MSGLPIKKYSGVDYKKFICFAVFINYCSFCRRSADNLSELRQSIRTWADLLESSDSDPDADYLTKRNILLAIVQYVKCTDNDGGVELGIVMNRNNKWRRKWDSNPR